MLRAVRGIRGGALFALGTGLVALALMTGGSGASAAPDGGGFNLAQVTTIAPDDTTHIAAPSGDGTRLFIVGQQGRIRLFKNGTLLTDPFLTVPNVAFGGERGLLSMAFAPDYVTSGLFYVYYTQQSPDLGAITIDEYKRSDANPDLADPNSRRLVLQIHHPRSNHNGGQLQFGPDGYLYIATGDGGGANDPDLAGQNLNVLLGKILRIDPRGEGFGNYTIPPDNPFYDQPPKRGEIWSYGLRNPWRFSFDRQTGDLTVADVGQNVWEEIDFSPRASGYGRGTNYGWSCREGRHDFNQGQPLCVGPPPPVLTDPVWEYPHSGGQHTGCSITGGYVIRDPALSSVVGRYVYGDACTSPLWHIQLQVPDAQGDTNSGESVGSLYTFGEDACARVHAGSGSGDGLSPDSDEPASAAGRLRAARGDADRRHPGRGGQRDLPTRPTGERSQRRDTPGGDLHRAGGRHVDPPQLPPRRAGSAVRSAFGLHDRRCRIRAGDVARELHSGVGHVPLRSASGHHGLIHRRGRAATASAASTSATSTAPATTSATATSTATTTTTATTAIRPELHRQRGLRRHHQPPQLVHAQ